MRNNKSIVLFFTALIFSCMTKAASSGGFGASVGAGVPFLSQAGINYYPSDKLGFYLGYNLLDIKVGTATAKLSMPELMVNYHPFAGAFFIGLGVGQETLKTTATDLTTSLEAAIEVTAMTSIAKLGWMWGVSNGGFWFGMDMSFISPSSPKKTITAPGLTEADQAYKDAEDAADKFGNTAYSNVTFARIGWLF